MEPLTILITGCNGLVACRLAKKLTGQGAQVFGISLNGLVNPYISAENYFQTDICDTKKIAEILDVINPSIVIHTAAVTKPDWCEQHPEDCFETNFTGTKVVVSESQKRNIYTIHLSTDFVFSGINPPHTESSTDFPPVNIYGQSKYEAERFILENYPQVAIVRTALVYGYEPLLPRNNIFIWAVEQLQMGNAIRVVNDQFRTPTFADDLADGLVKLCEKKLSGIFHIAGNDFMSVHELVWEIARIFGLNRDLISTVQTRNLDEPALRPKSTKLIIRKAQLELDYKPKSIVENLIDLKDSIPMEEWVAVLKVTA